MCRSIQKHPTSFGRSHHTQWLRSWVSHAFCCWSYSIVYFLCRQLIGKSINGTDHSNREEIVWQALQALHQIGPSHVIMSSISAAKMGGNRSMLQMYASSKISDEQYQTFQIDFPHLEGCFTGTGDSFSALVLAWFHKENNLIVSRSSYHFHSFLRSNVFCCSLLVKKPFLLFIKFY